MRLLIFFAIFDRAFRFTFLVDSHATSFVRASRNLRQYSTWTLFHHREILILHFWCAYFMRWMLLSPNISGRLIRYSTSQFFPQSTSSNDFHYDCYFHNSRMETWGRNSIWLCSSDERMWWISPLANCFNKAKNLIMFCIVRESFPMSSLIWSRQFNDSIA